MQKKVVKGNTENLNMLNEKVKYIGFELGEVPEILKDVDLLNYRIPRGNYDEKTYRKYKYIPVENIEILITPTNRLDELEKRYKSAKPLYTYMKAETNEQIENYAYFLKMINQTRIEDIEKIKLEQEAMKNEPPFEVKYKSNFMWQIYYSDYADKYFMLVSSEESDNSPMFYLLKKKLENAKENKKETVFVPISNEEYSGKILKKSEIEDLENYLWYFTKNWPSIYEVTNKEGNLELRIVGETSIYDKLTSKYSVKFNDKKEALNAYKLIKALFILSYDIQDEYKFETRISKDGGLKFYYKNEVIEYENLPQFLNNQALEKIKENINIKIETKELKADIKDLQKRSEEQLEEYRQKEKQIYAFLECKKTFLGKVSYYFKSKKKVKFEVKNNKDINKERVKDILNKDRNKEKVYDGVEENKKYTVEDIIKICKQLNENISENKNIKMDIKALKTKVENLDRKIKNSTKYLEEIDSHKKSIFAFWKFANKDEIKSLEVGSENENVENEKLRKTFDYEEDLEELANIVDKKQREKLTEREINATFAANFVLDGINVVSKQKMLKKDEEKIKKLLENLQAEYKENLDQIEKKDFDIFGNVAEDKTKIKVLKNNTHRESEKDKFKILNVNLKTELDEFKEKLQDLNKILKEESNKIKVPYDLSIYKASDEVIDTDGFNKFNINPQGALNKLNDKTKDRAYLYKINVKEGTNLIFYSNIVFYENTNGTLPLGMDISQETLINMDLYNLELKNRQEFNINVCEDEFKAYVREIAVFEYDLVKK